MSKREEGLAIWLGKHPEPLLWIKERCKVDSISGCWEWLNSKDSSGYGAVQARRGYTFNAQLRVSVIACTVEHGPRPEGAICRHLCDSRTCCNPEHLVWGTLKRNALDASASHRAELVRQRKALL